MIVVKNPKEMILLARSWRSRGHKIALVPTMGYFHLGHLSLMDMALQRADRVVVSLFVNPTQFGPSEDLDQYPRDLVRDTCLAKERGVHCLFIPDARQMYPSGFQTWVDVTELTKVLCGASRPGHFRGVATVVIKLFNIVQPDIAVFGQKDFQQLQVIKRMVTDLNMPIEILSHPIVREPDGLAMSSRNTYLNDQERKSALCLYKSLLLAQDLVIKGISSCAEIRAQMEKYILDQSFTRIDYIFLGDPNTLSEKEVVELPLLIALAVFVGKTRLIDNILIDNK